MLECHGLSVTYGQHKALENVSINISPGEIVVILGANGAGKSSLLKAVAGMLPDATRGRVLVDGKPVNALPPHRIVELGVAFVPEGRHIFSDLTVQENLMLGAYAHRARASEQEHLENVLSMFPLLAERMGQLAGTMSGGEQQMVAIGRAIMSSPAILMLDEPSLGLSPLLCTELFRTLVEIRKTGVGVLLVEQNAHQGLAIAERGYLLETGRIVGEGSADQLASDASVQEAYLGGSGEGAASAAPSPSSTPSSAPASDGATAVGSTAARNTSPAPPTLPPMVRPATPSRVGPRTSDLLHDSIDNMVRRASEIQADHVRTLRADRPVRWPVTAPPPPQALPAAASHPPAPSSPQAGSVENGAASGGTGSGAGSPDFREMAQRIRPRGASQRGSDSLREALARIEAAAADVLERGRASDAKTGPQD